jgi:mRNA interferase RelE/StbE
MSNYHVTFTSSAARAVRRFDRPTQRRLLDATDALAGDPRPHGVKALKGAEGLLRVRVGDYRIIYAVRDAELVVLVVKVAHRREVYRDL